MHRNESGAGNAVCHAKPSKGQEPKFSYLCGLGDIVYDLGKMLPVDCAFRTSYFEKLRKNHIKVHHAHDFFFILNELLTHIVLKRV